MFVIHSLNPLVLFWCEHLFRFGVGPFLHLVVIGLLSECVHLILHTVISCFTALMSTSEGQLMMSSLGSKFERQVLDTYRGGIVSIVDRCRVWIWQAGGTEEDLRGSSWMYSTEGGHADGWCD